ncbi:hypothetical protein ACFTS5_24790 [Nocardia sp. NPDC056952]|uniref:hypothetical protein n=1 Tax=Nocardia sp. NPDC056952 TaxID=3345979 RepID=UPI0036262F79
MAATTENTDQRDQSGRDAGRFFEIQQELSSKRRGPYRLTEDILIQPITRRQMRAIRDEQDEDKQLAIVLGQDYEAVEELFADRPVDEWLAFQEDLNAYFFGEGAAELPGGSQGS